jgi:hypothetical protein
VTKIWVPPWVPYQLTYLSDVRFYVVSDPQGGKVFSMTETHAHAAPPGNHRVHSHLTFPVETRHVHVVRRDGNEPGLVRTIDVAHATGLALNHAQHGDWLTFTQVEQLLGAHGEPDQRHAAFLAWLRPRLGASARREPVKPTRWGTQPLKALMSERHLTVADLHTELNASDVTRGNVGAAAVGAVLPRAELIDALVNRFGGEPAAYFTDEVLEAVEERETKRGLRERARREREERHALRQLTDHNDAYEGS